MIQWQRPSGNPIETNDKPETIEYCVKLGWVREGSKKKAVKKKAKKAT